MSKQETMTAAEFRLTGGTAKDESAQAITRRLFLFHIKARRLPVPRSKDHPEGEVVFMQGEVVARHAKARKLKTRGRAPEWRFDFAWPEHRIAVEVEGVTVVRAGKMFLIGGRHGTIDGFTEDCEKYAWAVVNGWRLMRFTQGQVKAGVAIDMLVRLFAALDGVWRAPVELLPAEVPRPVFPTQAQVDADNAEAQRLMRQFSGTTELDFAPTTTER